MCIYICVHTHGQEKTPIRIFTSRQLLSLASIFNCICQARVLHRTGGTGTEQRRANPPEQSNSFGFLWPHPRLYLRMVVMMEWDGTAAFFFCFRTFVSFLAAPFIWPSIAFLSHCCCLSYCLCESRVANVWATFVWPSSLLARLFLCVFGL